MPLLAVGLLFVVLFSACSGNAPAQVAHTAVTATTGPVAKARAFTKGAVVYVALGASDAVGVGSDDPGAQGYVPLIFQHLTSGSRLVNLGLSGIHLHAALTQELPIALSANPQLITIWLVANDFVAGVSYDSYMQDLNSLLQQLYTGTSARLVMANLPDLTLLPDFSHDNDQQKRSMRAAIQRWNLHIAMLAREYGVVLVDLTAQDSLLTAHPEYVSGDGFHPSDAGYVKLANLFWNAIV